MPLDFAVFGVYLQDSTIDLYVFNTLDIGTKGLIFLMILMPEDTFFERLAIWVFHVRNSSISTPTHLLQSTLFKEIPFIDTWLYIFSDIMAILCLEPSNINSVSCIQCSSVGNQPVFEALNINPHLFLEFGDTARGKSQVGVICVLSSS